ncbi:MAG TPA: hypothetical protein VFU80_01770 [Sphingomicrobium sp.]|nr:hypothetical protein [Sphingomicrobium sp.]
MIQIFAALALAGVEPIPATDNFGEPFPAFVPGDVRLFVIDAQACTHFGGEPYSEDDKERKAFLDEMIAKTCTNIKERKASLERRYRRSAEIKAVISNAWEE